MSHFAVLLQALMNHCYSAQYTTISKKDDRVAAKRERRAEARAHIEEAIKSELLTRLQKVMK